MPSGLRGSERAKGHHRASRPRERRQGLPRRIGRVGAPGLLTPDAVALLVGEPVALRRVIDLALDGFAGDGRAADIARPPGTAARHRDAAREWKTPIREPLAHGLPQHLGDRPLPPAMRGTPAGWALRPRCARGLRMRSFRCRRARSPSRSHPMSRDSLTPIWPRKHCARPRSDHRVHIYVPRSVAQRPVARKKCPTAPRPFVLVVAHHHYGWGRSPARFFCPSRAPLTGECRRRR